MSRIVYAFGQEDRTQLRLPSIFLAGPTPRSPEVPSWRPEALKQLDQLAFQGLVYVPEDKPSSELSWKENYDSQVDWEQAKLNRATVILFWIPRDLKTMPGFTTNIEWGCYSMMASHRMVLGYPLGADKMKYLQHNAEKLDIPVHRSLEGACLRAVYMAATSGMLHAKVRKIRHKLRALRHLLAS